MAGLGWYRRTVTDVLFLEKCFLSPELSFSASGPVLHHQYNETFGPEAAPDPGGKNIHLLSGVERIECNTQILKHKNTQIHKHKNKQIQNTQIHKYNNAH